MTLKIYTYMEKTKKTTRGTDETFLKLMTVSGSSILKLLGVPKKQAEKYLFRAVTLKEKRIEPDVEAIPKLRSKQGPVFIEFQGYYDPFIRYRLAASVFQSCAKQEYEGKAIAGIIYTDTGYKNAALPLSTVMGSEDCLVKSCFKEIVLTDYTEAELLAMDPKLIVLAPFTISKTTDKALVLEKGQEWGRQVVQVFPSQQHQEALDILGLFVLNRFRQLQYEEVIAMLNFDLMDTVAGRQLHEIGHQKGLMEDAREMLLEVLEERFGIVPNDLMKQIHIVPLRKNLKQLLRQAIRCPNIEGFEEMLSKATPPPKTTDESGLKNV
jgi:predicted transposase YdaD